MNLNFLTSSRDFNSAVISKEDFFPRGDGWIEWTGGVRPVSPDTRVKIRCRFDPFNGTYRAGSFNWGHSGSDSDVLFYKIVELK